MTDRESQERLVELIVDAVGGNAKHRLWAEAIADHLLANGVIVPPCKVGDKTFLVLQKISGGYDIVESKCVRITDNGYGKYYSMAIDCPEIGNTLEFGIYDFGKRVFLTKEEAEAKLKELKDNG